jgi:peptidoglycan hydrolase-like protein with peptidoglycan-binding domain
MSVGVLGRMSAFDDDDDRDRPSLRILPATGLILSLGLAVAIVWNAVFAQAPGRRMANSDTIELALPKGRAGPRLSVAVKTERPGPKTALIDLQRELAALKRYGGPIDGRLSPETRAALDAYRRTSGLPQRATVQDLLDHLRYTKTLKQVARSETTGSIGPDVATVRHVQTGLSELGYLPGPIDGTLGETTRQAIKEFEGDRRLPVSGEITPELLSELAKTSGQTTFLK